MLVDYNRKYDMIDGAPSPLQSTPSPSQRPICEQVIHEVSSDESPESDDFNHRRLSLDRGEKARMSPQRSSSFKFKEPSSESDFLESDVTIPSFSSDRERQHEANLQIASLMKGTSPLPSFQQTVSPIGRLEMDLDDLSSLHKFVYYSDEEPEESWEKSNSTPQTFMLKKQGELNME